jgi:hypothetical protein
MDRMKRKGEEGKWEEEARKALAFSIPLPLFTISLFPSSYPVHPVHPC